MKRQDKEIRMRHIGARAIVITLALIFIAAAGGSASEKKPILTGSVASAYTAGRALHEKLVQDKEEIGENLLLRDIERNLNELARIKEREIIEEKKRIEEEERLKAEEKRLKAEEEERRIAYEIYVESLFWSGSAGDYQRYCWSLFPYYGWDAYDLECLIELIRRESTWNPYAENAESGAYGLFQALPADKMASHGDDYWYNPYTQSSWGLSYISSRYGSPRYALYHSNDYGWY